MSSGQKKRAVVVCPGRGSYTKETLGYLKQYGGHIQDFLKDIDQRRKQVGEFTISELDNADAFRPNVHTRGEHASALIYACAYADFMAIDRDQYEIVAVTGNSMGWYLTLALGGSLDWASGFEVVNTMGSMMKETIVGNQVIYPLCDENWRRSPENEQKILTLVEKLKDSEGVEIHKSIDLGGYIVWGTNKAGTDALLRELPKVENYPFQLINHAAFHTPLLRETAERAFDLLPVDLFRAPEIPLIDGRGCIWRPYSTNLENLYHYTLGHQVVETYDFTRAITVALKEFAPDKLILLGPGSSLGGSLGQILIANDWLNLKSKSGFTAAQARDPFILAMGRLEQRPHVVRA